MRRLSLLAVRPLATAVLLLSMVTLPPSVAADSTPPIPAEFGFGGPQAQLLLLGTFHFKDAGLDGYKPKFDVDILSAERQQEVADVLDRLAAFAPTHIAVEWDLSLIHI